MKELYTRNICGPIVKVHSQYSERNQSHCYFV